MRGRGRGGTHGGRCLAPNRPGGWSSSPSPSSARRWARARGGRRRCSSAALLALPLRSARWSRRSRSWRRSPASGRPVSSGSFGRRRCRVSSRWRRWPWRSASVPPAGVAFRRRGRGGWSAAGWPRSGRLGRVRRSARGGLRGARCRRWCRCGGVASSVSLLLSRVGRCWSGRGGPGPSGVRSARWCSGRPTRGGWDGRRPGSPGAPARAGGEPACSVAPPRWPWPGQAIRASRSRRTRPAASAATSWRRSSAPAPPWQQAAPWPSVPEARRRCGPVTRPSVRTAPWRRAWSRGWAARRCVVRASRGSSTSRRSRRRRSRSRRLTAEAKGGSPPSPLPRGSRPPSCVADGRGPVYNQTRTPPFGVILTLSEANESKWNQ